MAALESMVELDRKLALIAEYKDRKDALLVEIIKLLKSNIESRLSLQMELMLLRVNIENAKTKKRLDDSDGKSTVKKTEPPISLEDRLLTERRQ